jgi:hypothetical protein
MANGPKKRAGRPKKPPRQQISITFPHEVKASLEITASSYGMSLSEYIRLRVLGFTDSRGNEPVEAILLEAQAPPKNWREFHDRAGEESIRLLIKMNKWRKAIIESGIAEPTGTGVDQDPDLPA